MKYNLVKNWSETLRFMKANPIVLMPFLCIGFFEGIVLLIAWFATRFPFSYILNPIIIKVYGEEFTHYPGVMYILPETFYFGQIIVWAFIAVFLTAVTVKIYKNLIEGRKANMTDAVKEILPNYFSFPILAIVVGGLFSLMGVVSMRILTKTLGITLAIAVFYVFKFLLLTFVVSSVPLIIFYKLNLFAALKKSIIIAVKNFSTIFPMIFLPFLLYFPVFFAKNFCAERYAKTMPDMNLYLSMAGILIILFIGCFILLCVTRFLLDSAQATEEKPQ